MKNDPKVTKLEKGDFDDNEQSQILMFQMQKISKEMLQEKMEAILLWKPSESQSAGTDEAALGEAWKIVKNAGLGILMIAISWIIVTFIFYIAGILTEDTSTENNAVGSQELEGTQNANSE